jgi:hypothetical protein
MASLRQLKRKGAIMRPTEFSATFLVELLRGQKIATLPELMAAMGANSRRTVFRKLKELHYRTSYSHRGRYYTLDELAEFDGRGLWAYKDVCFSVHGTLLSTAAVMVENAEYGYFVEELDNLLNVGTKDALRKLVRDSRLTRKEVAGRFLYCSTNTSRRRQQLLGRRALLAEPSVAGPLPDADIMPEELRAAIVLFFSLLDEKQRRLYAGLEALKTGHGGDVYMAELLGLNPGTVARGRRELLTQDVDVDRIRKTGGGRKPAEKKRRR